MRTVRLFAGNFLETLVYPASDDRPTMKKRRFFGIRTGRRRFLGNSFQVKAFVEK